MNACMCSSDECRVKGCAAQRTKMTAAAQADLTGIRRVTIGGPQAGTPLPGAVFPIPNMPPAPKPIRAGWECPRCRAILAPHVDRCSCKAPA